MGAPHTHARGLLNLFVLGAFLFLLVSGAASVGASGSDRLVAAYGFEELSGETVRDASGNGNDGTISGATSAPGRHGSGLSFDGVDDLVTIADSGSLDVSSALTIEAWVMLSGGGSSWRTVVLKERPAGLAYGLYAYTNSQGPSGHVGIGSKEPRARAGSPVGDREWKHVAMTYDGSAIRVYSDGSEIASTTANGALDVSAGELRIGGNRVWNEWFAGTIDDVRIYARALSPDEIRVDMATAVTAALPPLPPLPPPPIPPTLDTTPPTAPNDLSTSGATQSAITLSWTGSSDDTGVAGYRLYRDGISAGTTGAPARSHGFEGLACGSTYVLAVDAYDGAGNHSARSSVTGSTAACATPPAPDTQAPADPPNLAVTGTTTSSISVSWSASSDNVGVTGYGLYRNGSSTGSVGGSARSATFSGLACGTTYTLGVDAFDGASNRSARSTVTAASSACPAPSDTTPPSAPPGVATTGSTQTSISVAWNGSSDNVAVTGYGLYRDGNAAGSVGSSARSATFSGLACGQSYTIAVDAVDAAGNRSSRSAVSGATASCQPGSQGASVYLSPAGSDANPCTAAAPCRTIDRGYRVAKAGDVVQMAGGSYGGQTLPSDPTKTSSTDVIITAAPGATVNVSSMSIAGDHAELRGLTIGQSYYVRCTANDVTLRDSKAKLLFIRSASNISIVDSEFGDVPNSVSQIGPGSNCTNPPTNVLLDGIYMHDYYSSPFNSVHEECLMVTGVIGFTLRNSKFHRCEDFDILFKRYGTEVDMRDLVLENNWFDDPYPDGTSAIQFSEPSNGGSFTNMLIRNNSFGATLTLKPEVSYVATHVIGNVGTRYGGPCSGISSGYNVWSGTAPCSSTDRQAPTGYVNQSGFDFHLAAGAAAIDRGDPSSFPARDIDGDARPRGGAPDAGADER